MLLLLPRTLHMSLLGLSLMPMADACLWRMTTSVLLMPQAVDGGAAGSAGDAIPALIHGVPGPHVSGHLQPLVQSPHGVLTTGNAVSNDTWSGEATV